MRSRLTLLIRFIAHLVEMRFDLCCLGNRYFSIDLIDYLIEIEIRWTCKEGSNLDTRLLK